MAPTPLKKVEEGDLLSARQISEHRRRTDRQGSMDVEGIEMSSGPSGVTLTTTFDDTEGGGAGVIVKTKAKGSIKYPHCEEYQYPAVILNDADFNDDDDEYGNRLIEGIEGEFVEVYNVFGTYIPEGKILKAHEINGKLWVSHTGPMWCKAQTTWKRNASNPSSGVGTSSGDCTVGCMFFDAYCCENCEGDNVDERFLIRVYFPDEPFSHPNVEKDNIVMIEPDHEVDSLEVKRHGFRALSHMDGRIGFAKMWVDSGNPVPQGWMSMSYLNNTPAFPRGGAIANIGNTGGTTTHSHTLLATPCALSESGSGADCDEIIGMEVEDHTPVYDTVHFVMRYDNGGEEQCAETTLEMTSSNMVSADSGLAPTVDGEHVSQVTDQGTGNDFTSPDADSSPLYRPEATPASSLTFDLSTSNGVARDAIEFVRGATEASSDYLEGPASYNISEDNNTVFIVARVDDKGTLISDSINVSVDGTQFEIDANGNPKITFSSSSGVRIQTYETTSVGDGSWHVWAFRLKTDGTIDLYDGQRKLWPSKVSGPVRGSMSTPSKGNEKIQIGRAQGGGADLCLDGMVSYFEIVDGYLSEADILSRNLRLQHLYQCDRVTHVDPAPQTSGLKVHWDFTDVNNLWQDSAGTVPVTEDGQGIGRVDDLSGNGIYALQTTSSREPLYKTDGPNGLPAARFDSSNDGLDAEGRGDSHCDIGATDDFSTFVVFTKTDDDTSQLLNKRHASGAGNDPGWYIGFSAVQTTFLQTLFEDVLGNSERGSGTDYGAHDGAVHVHTTKWDHSAGFLEYILDSVVKENDTGVGMVGTDMSDASIDLVLGMRKSRAGTLGNYHGGDIAVVVITKDITASEYARTMEYMLWKAGL